MQTPNIHAEPIRIRARNIVRFAPAVLAEIVLGDAGVERVDRKRAFSSDQPKRRARDDQVEKTGALAHRAVALVCLDILGCVDFHFDCTAMAASGMTHDSSFDMQPDLIGAGLQQWLNPGSAQSRRHGALSIGPDGFADAYRPSRAQVARALDRLERFQVDADQAVDAMAERRIRAEREKAHPIGRAQIDVLLVQGGQGAHRATPARRAGAARMP